MSHAKTSSDLGSARFSFASPSDVDTFVDTLAKFERGEIDADTWRAFRLVNGAYGQRQEGDLSMLRVKIPQGALTAEQLRAIGDVTQRWSRGFSHITTRQNVQLHFVKLSEMGDAMHALAAVGLTTKEACGNSVRNVTTSATAGVAGDEIFDPLPYAQAFTRFFLRHQLASTLPRKFKVAFSGGGSDHSFVTINDIGFFAAIENGVRGFRITVAGGTATVVTSGRLLFPFLPAEDIFAVGLALLEVFHAKGDRVHRHKNRMKFLVKAMGWDAFHAAFHERFAIAKQSTPKLVTPEGGFPEEHAPDDSSKTPQPTSQEIAAFVADDPMRGPGIVPRFLPTLDDREGRFFKTNVKAQRQKGYSIVTVTVPLGDLSSGRWRALARLAESFSDGTVRTTPTQNIVFRWVKNDEVRALYTHLRTLGLSNPDPTSLADVGSCPGAESCKLAVTQSRGLAELVNAAFEKDRALLDRAAGLEVRVSGCPNGCGLHHVAGLGFQGGMRKVGGRAVPQYFVYVGGDASGNHDASGPVARFGRLAAKIPARRVPQAISRLIELFEKDRREDESITAFLGRVELIAVKRALADLEQLEESHATDADYIDLGETQAFAPDAKEGECAA